MTRAFPTITLDETAQGPLFVRLARRIAEDIRRGRLKPGQRLPGSRRLAQELGIHRNTVLAALSELEQEGWIATQAKRGTFVADDIPKLEPKKFGNLIARGRVKFDLPEPAPAAPFVELPRGVVPLVGGQPDLRLVPRALLSRALRRALMRSPISLGYGSEWGDVHLRRALATLLAETRGLNASEDGVLVTRGSQMAIYLAAKVLLAPGSVVAVEELGYRPAWEALKLAGARLMPIPVDEHGLQVARLAELLRSERVSAVYVTPHHQYPTTVTLTPARRLELLALAREWRFPILEDDYDHEHHYAGRPILPLASVDPDIVVYIGTLSKVLAPALRIGYLIAAPEILEHATRLRRFVDHQGDTLMERAIAELIEEGELVRHMRRVRRHYHERRDALVEALRRELGRELAFKVPSGGMALWAKTKSRVSTDAWAARALSQGVLVQEGRRFRLDGRPMPAFRLGFAPVTPQEIRSAVRKFAAAMVERTPTSDSPC
jgi:GntR family transcriptional regulator/MocR family aminotransferase